MGDVVDEGKSSPPGPLSNVLERGRKTLKQMRLCPMAMDHADAVYGVPTDSLRKIG